MENTWMNNEAALKQAREWFEGHPSKSPDVFQRLYEKAVGELLRDGKAVLSAPQARFAVANPPSAAMSTLPRE